MHDLVKAKYMQNNDMAQKLIQTENRKLGETGKGSDYAIGIPFTHPKVLDSTGLDCSFGDTRYKIQDTKLYLNSVW